MEYTPAQRQEIATIDGHLQIIACAGSGKTQVIAARSAHILQQKAAGGVHPANIVACTFTDRAAAERKDRVHRLCRETPDVGEEGLAEMYVGTIHGYCRQLLQAAPLYQYLKYTMLTDVRQQLFVARPSNESGLSQVPYAGQGKIDYLKRWQDSRLYLSLLGILGEANVAMTRAPAAVRDAQSKYYELLAEKHHLDYTMMIATPVAPIPSPAPFRATLHTPAQLNRALPKVRAKASSEDIASGYGRGPLFADWAMKGASTDAGTCLL
jgi:DNA helicase-2/ATP-dependent DNA helicase PcrA